MARASPGVVFLTLVQVGCSVAVITLTNGYLVTDSSWGSDAQLCYLNGDKHDASMCSFAVAVGVVSLCSALLSGCLRCISCDCCGLGPVSNILLAILNSIWWLVSAAILTAGTVAADVSHLPRSGYRHALLAVAWTAAVAEFIHSIIACLVVGNNVCNWLCGTAATPHDEECCASCEDCCPGCCCPRQRHHQRQHQHHSEPLLHPDAVAVAAAGLAATAALQKQSWWDRLQSRPQRAAATRLGQGLPGQRPGAAWQQPAAAAAAGQATTGAYMPPPPTAGQPYVYHPPAAVAGTAVGVPLPAGASYPAAAAGANRGGSSFGGFAQHGHGSADTPDPIGSTLTPAAAAAGSGPTAPYAPPVVIQQRLHHQQHVAPGVHSMSADVYPSIPKQ